VHIEVEHDRHERRLVRFRRQVSSGGINVVAEGPRSPTPGATRRLSLHAGDHPVHDGGPLELGEHAKHLDHHPPRRRRRVEGLGRRAEGNSGSVEVFEELGEAAHRAGEPVHPVDEQEVEAAGRASAMARFKPGRSVDAPEAWSVKRRVSSQPSWLFTYAQRRSAWASRE
jgi:hypothetical protein